MKIIYFPVILFLFLFLFEKNIGQKIHKKVIKQTIHRQSQEKLIFNQIASEIIRQNKDDIININDNNECKIPLSLSIQEYDGNYNGFKCFGAYFKGNGLPDHILPTILFKKKGVYVAVYQQDRIPLVKQKVPKILFKECDDRLRYEKEWIILICNDFNNIRVIYSGNIPCVAIRQYQNFSCSENKIMQEITIENPIVDEAMMDTIIKSIQPVDSLTIKNEK